MNSSIFFGKNLRDIEISIANTPGFAAADAATPPQSRSAKSTFINFTPPRILAGQGLKKRRFTEIKTVSASVCVEERHLAHNDIVIVPPPMLVAFVDHSTQDLLSEWLISPITLETHERLADSGDYRCSERCKWAATVQVCSCDWRRCCKECATIIYVNSIVFLFVCPCCHERIKYHRVGPPWTEDERSGAERFLRIAEGHIDDLETIQIPAMREIFAPRFEAARLSISEH